MTKRRFHLAAIVMTALSLAALMAIPAGAATKVTDITIAPSGEFVELSVVGGGTLLCDQFSEPATNERPFRIVLDFCDAEHALGKLNFESLPACRVARVRTSQFATTPRSIVRVVLDMKENATFSVTPSGANLTVRIADPSHGSFAMWHANPNAAPVMAQSAPAKPVVQPAKDQSAAQMAVKESKSTSKPAQTVAKSDAKPVEKPVVVAEKPASKPVEKPVVVAEKPASKPVEKPVVMADKPAAKPVEKTVVAEKPVSKSVEKPLVVAEKPATVESKPMPQSQQPMADNNMKPASKALPLPKTPLVFAPEYMEPTDKPMTADASNKVPVSIESMQPMGPQMATVGPDGKPMANAQGPAPAMWATTTPGQSGVAGNNQQTAQSGEVSPADEALDQSEGTLLERLKTKFFGEQSQPRPYTTVPLSPGGDDTFGPPSPNANISREALLERIRLAQERMASGLGDSMIAGVGSVPTRDLLFYDDLARRDPFSPLVSGQRSGFLSNELPNLENLRLVGVLRDDLESLALLENLEGFSYVLRVGDPVQNGSLVSIQPNRALFRVDDYGWSHVVALQLTSRGTDPSKSLGAVQQVFPTYEDDKTSGSPAAPGSTTEPKGSEGE